MLKCGQKDNQNYTFGVRKDQMEVTKVAAPKRCCSACGVCVTDDAMYCPQCGEEL
tara:strand:- start:2309 stop:2473 length:165 start_codon:yes stop_codon:yes gene_type:complete